MDAPKTKTVVIFICVMLLHFFAFSQSKLPTLKLPIGHTNYINGMDFSANGKLLATAGEDGQVILWDTRTGKVIRSLFIKGPILKVLFTGDSKYIFVLEKAGIAKVGYKALSLWEVKTGNRIEEYKFAGSEDIATSPNGNTVLIPQQTSLKDAITAKFGDAEEDKDEKDEEEDEDDKEAEKMMAMFDFAARTDSVFIFDYIKNKRIGGLKIGDYDDPFEGFSAALQYVSFENNLYIIALENPDGDGKKSNRIRIWNASNTSSPLRTISSKNHMAKIAASLTDGYFAIASKNQVTIRQIKLNNAVDSFTLKGENIEQLSFSQNGNRLLCKSGVNGEKKIRIWDLKQHKFIFHQIIKETTEIPVEAVLSPQGNYFAFANNKEARIIDIEGNHMHSLKGFLLNTGRAFFSENNRYLVTKPPSKEDKLKSLNWAKKTIEQIKPDEGDSEDEIRELKKAKQDAETKLKAGMAELELERNAMPVWDLITGSNEWVPVPPKELRINDEVIKTTNDTVSNNKHFVLLNDSWYGFKMDGIDFVSESSMFTGDFPGMKKLSSNIRATAPLVSRIKYLINTVSKDTLKLMVIDSANWIIIDQKGYFKTTPNAAVLLHYVTDKDEVISFEQLDLKFNRPDLILEALENPNKNLIAAYKLTYENRLARNKYNSKAFSNNYLVPEGDFTKRDEIQYNQKSETIQLNFSAKANGTKITKFNLWVNEVPLFGLDGIMVTRKLNEGFDTTLTIHLSAGKNKIEASVFNENTFESYRMPLWVNYIVPKPIQSKTWLIGIGVNKYADPAHNNLKYTIADIRSLVSGLRAKAGLDLIVDTLFNENFTIEKLNIIRQKLANVQINDRVILVYSGHGVVKEGKYYFPISAMNKQDFADPASKAISYEALESLLGNTPARNKLFLIDACHSGTIDTNNVTVLNDITTSEIMDELFTYVGRGTGATVLTSSSGDAKSLESDQLKHGFFTQGILNALKEEKTISVTNLKNYLLNNVPLISKQQQKPTVRAENRECDFRVW